MSLKLTGKPIEKINISGWVFPWYEDTNQPVLLFSPSGTGPPLLPVFSSPEKLKETVQTWMTLDRKWKIKQIDDQNEFLDSIGEYALVAAEPYQHNGNTRFTNVFRNKGEHN